MRRIGARQKKPARKPFGLLFQKFFPGQHQRMDGSADDFSFLEDSIDSYTVEGFDTTVNDIEPEDSSLIEFSLPPSQPEVSVDSTAEDYAAFLLNDHNVSPLIDHMQNSKSHTNLTHHPNSSIIPAPRTPTITQIQPNRVAPNITLRVVPTVLTPDERVRYQSTVESAVPSPASSPPLTSPDSENKRKKREYTSRNPYKCSKCGLPKKGHDCSGIKSPAIKAATTPKDRENRVNLQWTPEDNVWEEEIDLSIDGNDHDALRKRAATFEIHMCGSSIPNQMDQIYPIIRQGAFPSSTTFNSGPCFKSFTEDHQQNTMNEDEVLSIRRVYEQLLKEKEEVIEELIRRLRQYEDVIYPPLFRSQSAGEQKSSSYRFYKPTLGSLYHDDVIGFDDTTSGSSFFSSDLNRENCYHLSNGSNSIASGDDYELEEVEYEERGEEMKEGRGEEETWQDSEEEEVKKTETPALTVKDKVYKDCTEVVNRFSEASTRTPYRDWNAEYQVWYEQFVRLVAPGKVSHVQYLELNSHVLTNLNRIAQQFADTATIYAKIIISEFELPLHRKSIKPIDLGGVAGGTKYRVQNIMYKFAFDTLLVDEPALWMYGGQTADHRAASKGAANEMKGLEAHASTYVEGLSYPMMALVDYLGFRVVAMAVLPIDKTTLRYGSDDGGATVHDDDAELSEKMRVAAERLKLKGHMTGHVKSSAKKIYGPGDIEGHRGHDGRLYVVDFSRLLPPVDPATRLERKPRSVFYECLRPEMVLSSDVPLCSDAFTRWNSDEEEKRKENNEELRQRTYKMLNINIGVLTNILGRVTTHLWTSIRKSVFDENVWNKLNFLTSMMHMEGCNTRYLGQLWSLVEDEETKRIIMSVAIARCAKSELREIMRLRMRQVQAPYFKKEAARFLNQLIGTSKHSKLYWRRDLCRQLRDWFWFDLTREQVKKFHVKTMADRRIVLNLTLIYNQIELHHKTETMIRSGEETTQLYIIPTDIKTIQAKTRQRSDIYFSYGMLTVQVTKKKIEKAKRRGFSSLPAYAMYMRKQIPLAVTNLQWAVGNNPASGLYLLCWASANMEMARELPDEMTEFTYQLIIGYIFRSFEVWPDCPGRIDLMAEAIRYYTQFCEKRRDEEKILTLNVLRDKVMEVNFDYRILLSFIECVFRGSVDYSRLLPSEAHSGT
ncbi:hypothetical protein PROFUN_07366 [Planoprotostelium fungivorum]|uniref:Clu domain-containing protein n=1 Tax=Planoprotostelium fungivorum TaxID=1890364 RepID=A0A2P6NLZ2_9EUKA|nr:hypothetical protein PROFUN_07366 [Planoprotostelium fungivorum]